jgi:A/G-specific adenine glycosylase
MSFTKQERTIWKMKRTEKIGLVQKALLAWYEIHQRDLPWRHSQGPYAVWLSEIMLQQTQVATVIPYYHRFLKAFPSIRALAESPLDKILKLWEGLGYYSRARNLHKAAQKIVTDFDNRFPETIDSLLTLPGIGQYTAGAIASIAFNLDEPVLDGNVERVLCRLFRIASPPKETLTHRRLWSLARTLVPTGRAGYFNQALMDLGATLCTPRKPECERCPLENLCKARQHAEQNDLPVKTPCKKTPHYEIAAGIIWKGNKILIDERPAEGLLGGLWEFPGGKLEKGETLESCLLREIREELDIEVTIRHELIVVKQAYSHFRITLHAFECDYLRGRPRALGCVRWKWVSLRELKNYAFPRANQKIIAALQAEHRTKK